MKASELRAILRKCKLTSKAAAEALGISLRMLNYYTSDTDHKPIPKTVQLALDSLVRNIDVRDFNIGDKVVRINKRTKPKVWNVVGFSNVFRDSAACSADDELLNHFSFDELRHAEQEEINANKRLDESKANI